VVLGEINPTKLYIKVMLLVVVVAALAGPIVIKGPNGKPLLSLPDGIRAAARVKASVRAATDMPVKPITVFKWRDVNGRWHFSDTAERGQPTQTVSMDPGANAVRFTFAEHTRSVAPTADGCDYQHDSGAASGTLGTLTKLIGIAKHVGPLQKARAVRMEYAMHE